MVHKIESFMYFNILIKLAYRNNISKEIYTAYAGAAAMLLYRHGE